MTLKEFREQTKDDPDDMVIAMFSDAEGNQCNLLYEIGGSDDCLLVVRNGVRTKFSSNKFLILVPDDGAYCDFIDEDED